MACGLIKKWRQPIYFDFDQSMTTQIMHMAITAMEEAGYLVYSITSDLGAENRALFKA